MADDTNEVAESNENNNWGAAWPVTLAGTPGDDYEPDDIPDDATVVTCGVTHAHTVEVDEDVDWSAITLQVGQKLTVETLNLSGTNPDTLLQLYAPGCQWIGEDDNGGVGAASRMEWIATEAGIHNIKAFTYGGGFGFCDHRGGGNATCAYDIRFSCCPPPPAVSNPAPPSGATDVPLNVTLCWSGVERSADDASGRSGIVEYDVHFGVCGSMQSLTTTTNTCWTPPAVQPNKEYCWNVTTKDNCGAVPGPGPWTFETVIICPAGLVTWDEPPGGVLDARQPRKIDDAGAAQGIDTLVVRAPTLIDPPCWSLCETLAEGPDNHITGVLDDGQGTYTLTLERRITPGAVTRITYASPTPQTGTFTSLPGDSNSDGVSAADDIAAMVHCCLIGGCATPSAYRCDINHSGGIDSADMLRVIDLHNGAGEFTRAWQNAQAHDHGECD
jgi:hypothetical protein